MTARFAALALFFCALACAGPAPAPQPSQDKPWKALEGDWIQADLVDGKPAFLQTCEPDSTCCWVRGDSIQAESGSGEGFEYEIVASRQEGDVLVLETKAKSTFRARRDGQGVAWSSDANLQGLMYPPGTTLPTFRECCEEEEGLPYERPTGEVVPEGQSCKGEG